MELSGSNIKKISYISGNGNPKKLLIFQEVNFPAQKKKKKKSNPRKFLIPQEMEAPKKYLIFSQ